jgi:DNA polymerase-1
MADLQPYVHATSAGQAQRWLADVAGVQMVAVDTETSGWDPWLHRLRLVQVAAPGHPVLVLDAEQVHPQVLAPLLSDRGVLKVFHHGSFDLRFLAVAGVDVRRVADTMLAQQLLDGGEKTATGIGLAGIAAYRLGMTLDKSVRETFGDDAPLTDVQLRYAAEDAAATLGVFEQQWRELVGHGLTRVAQLEFAALPVMAAMQLRGVSFDAPRWRGELARLEQELPALETTVQETLVTDTSPQTLFGPEPVNLESPEQLTAALGRLGLELPSTREVVLRDHADHPAVAALLRYRQVAKVTSNWGGDWADRVAHPVTGRVHADWRQIVGTGRISCSDPNLTQVPKEARYRACFGGADGRLLVVADYSQQELRILAAVSGDAALAEIFRQEGDLHRTTAAMAFRTPEDAVTPAQRAAAKALNFGLMYGMGAAGFARSTGMSLEAAQEAMDAYFATFGGVARWLAEAEAGGRRTGRVRTPLGRVRALDPAAGSIVTLARNAPIQGAGADMTKLAMAAVERRLAERFGDPVQRPDGLILVVHDELVVDVPHDAADEAATLVGDGMREAAAEILGDVPAKVDVTVQQRWGAVEQDVPADGVGVR